MKKRLLRLTGKQKFGGVVVVTEDIGTYHDYSIGALIIV